MLYNAWPGTRLRGARTALSIDYRKWRSELFMEFPKTVLSLIRFYTFHLHLMWVVFLLQKDNFHHLSHTKNNDNCQNFHNLSLHFDSTQFDLFTIKF